ncbi:MAG: DNA mismatch repair endonuclease MutL [Clostridiales bacterium]|nr:DNA mismatch repair endonuclease MutL [Clostridiales bacterium]
MNDIKVLDKSIYNRIAAGEVVEKPASIVKELVENSIDAGATAISIEIKNGGVDYICVSDNGKGISPQDVPTAFLAHATSKIKDISDLDSIATLGFRGEALPSIAAVSKVTMISRKHDSQMGYRHCIDHGVVVDSGEYGAPKGTSVTVENVFGNIPARKKFLQKSNIEENTITALISKIILANYNISIALTINGKTVYRSAGTGLENAIYCVYGPDFLKDLIKIDAEANGIKIYGYIGNPSFTKHAKTYQTVIANGRYVISDEISYWMYGCYQDFLMKRQFPVFILYIDLPYDLIDVNVHPNKLEVKFACVGIIKGLLTNTVKEIINQNARIAKEISNVNTENVGEEFILLDETENEQSFIPANKTFEDKKETFEFPSTRTILSRETEEKAQLKETSTFTSLFTQDLFNSIADHSSTKGFDFSDKNSEVIKESKTDAKNELIEESNNLINTDTFTQNDSEYEFVETNEVWVQEKSDIGEEQLTYVGKIFNTYLIFESGAYVFFVDQHAAHERILYDKLEKDFKEKRIAVQNLLIPYTFTVTTDEFNVINEFIPTLKDYGFDLDTFGNNTFSLKGIPARCGEMSVADFMTTLLSDITNKRTIDNLSIFKDKLMQNACKSAIKGDMNISNDEIKMLIADMQKNNVVLYCPHGRPIVIKISKTEVEKWFKRIV